MRHNSTCSLLLVLFWTLLSCVACGPVSEGGTYCPSVSELASATGAACTFNDDCSIGHVCITNTNSCCLAQVCQTSDDCTDPIAPWCVKELGGLDNDDFACNDTENCSRVVDDPEAFCRAKHGLSADVSVECVEIDRYRSDCVFQKP